MIAHRPVFPHQHLSQPVITSAPVVAAPSPAASAVSGAPVPEGLLWTALAAAAAWASIRTGMREKGFPSYAGYAGGVAAGLGALLGLAGVVAPSAARSLPVRWYWTA